MLKAHFQSRAEHDFGSDRNTPPTRQWFDLSSRKNQVHICYEDIGDGDGEGEMHAVAKPGNFFIDSIYICLRQSGPLHTYGQSIMCRDPGRTRQSNFQFLRAHIVT